MDLSYWNKLVPNIAVVPTTKLFFKQYTYKLELLAYGGQAVNNPASVEESISYRRISYRQINYGGSWAVRSKENITHADIAWLNYLQRFKQSPDFVCKIRVEEPNIQIYSESEQDLYNFAKTIPQEFRKYIKTISRPESEAAKSLIQSGKKIQKKPPSYRYKLVFRDGSYDAQIRSSVLDYLDSLGNLVRVPNHFREEFTKRFNSTWDCYIYSNDVKIATFIQLMNPNLIRSIIEAVTVEDINTDIIQGSYNG